MVRKRHKYSAKRVFEDGIMFDSKWEHKRYRELKLLQTAGEISDLEIHPSYLIEWPLLERRVGPPEPEDENDPCYPYPNTRICTVILDFRYVDAQGYVRVEDTKGVRTALSNLKRKLVEAAHGIKVDVIEGRI